MPISATGLLRRISFLPLSLRLPAGVALVGLLGTLGIRIGLQALHLQLLLLAGVLAVALLFGVAAGVVGATAGFAALLWQGLTPERGGGWTLGMQPLLDAFLWFALAKLTAALVAAPRNMVGHLAAAHEAATEEAQRHALLLGEVSHRVMNDLQRLAGLLDAQARAEPAAAGSLQTAARRVQVLARLHNRLTTSRGEAEVDSLTFLESVVEDLRATVAGGPLAVTLAAESHPLPAAAAADIGLAVNELVTNALKHAFPAGRAGQVRIRFGLEVERDLFALQVADDGIGLANTQRRRGAPRRDGGFGSRLVQALAAQLGGRVEMTSGEVGGTSVTLRFPVPPRQQAESETAVPPGAEATGAGPAADASGRPDDTAAQR